MKGSRALLLCGTCVVSVAATLWMLLVFLAPNEPVARVSFGELEADVRAARVQEIRIHGRVYTYSVRGAPGAPKHQATGPEPTLAQVRALRPAEPTGMAPKVFFEL